MVEVKDSQERPRFLRWKCIDDFPNMNKNKMFYIGNYTPTQSTIDTLTPIFEDIKQRYTKQIKELFSTEKKQLNVCGGQYTFFFVLPKVIKEIAKKYPFLNINFILEDLTVQDIANKSYDVILSGFYLDGKNSGKIAKNDKYYHSRQYFDDKVFLSVSKDAIKEYENIEAILKNHNILFGRLDVVFEKKYLYSVAPVGREGEDPKVVVDSYYMLHLMMLYNVGIAMSFSSMSKMDIKSLIVCADDILSTARRIVFFKKHPENLNYFSKIFFKCLVSEGT